MRRKQKERGYMMLLLIAIILQIYLSIKNYMAGDILDGTVTIISGVLWIIISGALAKETK